MEERKKYRGISSSNLMDGSREPPWYLYHLKWDLHARSFMEHTTFNIS